MHFPLFGTGHDALEKVPAALLEKRKLPVGELPPLSEAVQDSDLLPTDVVVSLQDIDVVVDGKNVAPL